MWYLTGNLTILDSFAMALIIACLIHQYTYVESLYPLSGSNFSTPLRRPMLPSCSKKKKVISICCKQCPRVNVWPPEQGLGSLILCLDNLWQWRQLVSGSSEKSFLVSLSHRTAPYLHSFPSLRPWPVVLRLADALELWWFSSLPLLPLLPPINYQKHIFFLHT